MKLFTIKGLVASLLALSAIVGMLTVGTHALFTDSTANTGNSIGSGELTAPSLSQPTASGGSVPLSWTAATLPGNASHEDEITYTVERKLGSGSFGSAGGTCTGSLTTTSCTDSLSTNGTYTYRVIAHFRSWTATSNERTATVALGGAPAAPTTVALADGGGVGNAYINDANKSNLSVNVGLPASSVATNTVHVVITDGAAHSTVDETTAATTGAGTATVTGIDASGLDDGSVTISAHVSNASGDSAPTTTSVTKDTVKPSSTAGTVANIVSPASTFDVPYTTTEPGASLDEVRLYVDGPAAGANYVHEETDTDPSQTGDSFSYDGATTDGTYNFYTRAVDNAGNLEDAPTTPPDSSASRVSPTSPTVTAGAIAKTEGLPNSTAGFIRAGTGNLGTYRIYANVNAGTSAIASVTANTSQVPGGAASVSLSACSADCTVNGVTYNYVSGVQTATATTLQTVRGFSVTASDGSLSHTLGNTTSSSALTVTVDNTAPGFINGNGNAISTIPLSTGTAGRAESGDKITFTYDSAIDGVSLISSWFYPWTAATSDVRVTLVDGGTTDSVSITTADGSATVPFGTVTFTAGGNYVSGGNVTFGGTGASTASTLAASAATFTVTLGSENVPAGASLLTDPDNQRILWTPNVAAATAVYDRAGNRVTDNTQRQGNNNRVF